MLSFLIRRILLTIPALLGVVLLVFSLVHIVPGDPVQIMLGDGAQAADIEQLRSRLGLDLPIWEQCFRYLFDLSRGNMGTSFRFGEPVASVIRERYPATLQLAFLSLSIGILLALPAGILAASQAGRWIDRAIT